MLRPLRRSSIAACEALWSHRGRPRPAPLRRGGLGIRPGPRCHLYKALGPSINPRVLSGHLSSLRRRHAGRPSRPPTGWTSLRAVVSLPTSAVLSRENVAGVAGSMTAADHDPQGLDARDRGSWAVRLRVEHRREQGGVSGRHGPDGMPKPWCPSFRVPA